MHRFKYGIVISFMLGYFFLLIDLTLIGWKIMFFLNRRGNDLLFVLSDPETFIGNPLVEFVKKFILIQNLWLKFINIHCENWWNHLHAWYFLIPASIHWMIIEISFLEKKRTKRKMINNPNKNRLYQYKI